LRGALLPDPIEKTTFTLTTAEGEPFDFAAETDSTVTLLFFGYTYCPDICPVHMANIAAALRKLPPQISNQVTVIMVSVDPERDTPERLRTWLDNFDRSFIGLLGSTERVNEIQIALRLPPAVKQETEGEGYLMGHAAQVMAFTADNRAHVLYPSGTRQVDWAHDIPLLVERDWSRR
jgi:protein SCO1/2